ncbi:hypothetical protein MNEG_6583, partial [Monoraphidium neglectum]
MARAGSSCEHQLAPCVGRVLGRSLWPVAGANNPEFGAAVAQASAGGKAHLIAGRRRCYDSNGRVAQARVVNT